MSTKTGVPRSYKMQLAEAMKLKDGVMTSSPSPMPAAIIVKCRPLVPELTATANLVPIYLAKRSSNSVSLGPRASQRVLSTSLTASISFWVMSGEDIGICIVNIIYHEFGEEERFEKLCKVAYPLN